MLLSALVLTAIQSPSYAQLSVSINIGTQPAWGPSGYDQADYYYLPDVESYYSVRQRQFIYLSNGRWIYSASLPARYRNYDLYSGYKVVVNRPRPYLNYSQDKVQYARYKNYRSKQTVIRDSRDVRYKQRGNPHGMPPGQAKKFENRGNNNRNDNRGRGPENHGGPGKQHDNGNHGGGNNHDNSNHGGGNKGGNNHGSGEGHGHH